MLISVRALTLILCTAAHSRLSALMAIDGAPSARLPESEAGAESEAKVIDMFCDFKFRGRGECGASTPSPSVFEGNHGGTKPSFVDGKDCSSCRHALLLLLENGIVVLYFKRKLPV